MAIQDPVEESIPGDLGVVTVKTTVKIEPDMNEEELVKATGIDGSNLEWMPGVPLIKIEDKNVTRSSPIQLPVEAEIFSRPESPGNKKLCL